ncbi:TonB-dependent receptor plug domain-containing protein [Glaciecola siphonariae]|uniref:TonB-dependent receptor plug domain-containing protein n=1 Tax=Glaciecola siphonariae TaxID=521012 RepID=A0ABV9LYZ5_9ALTE
MNDTIQKASKFRVKKLAWLIACSPLAFAAPTAFAQSPDASANNAADSSVENISVIGSRRVGRTVNDSSVPIDIIDADAISATGLTETNMILNTLLPSFNFPQPSITDGTDHVRPAQLRGLAPDHTLVLVNGKRRHTSALLNLNGSSGRGSSAVDLNAIPANAIKRIEVLRDGAAAQYGSDAIAGVINIVLKDASEGGEFSLTYGANVTTMDGVPDLVGVSEDANGNLAFTEGDDRELTDGQTATLRGNMGFEWGDDGFVHISGEYRDRSNSNRADYDQRENFARTADGSLDARERLVNRYNHNFGNGAVEDFALFVNTAKGLNNDMEFYAFGAASKRNSKGSGFYRRAQDSRNVAGIYPNGFLPTIKTDINDLSIVSGVKGQGDVWAYNVSINHGRNELDYSVINSLNTSFGLQSPTDFDAGGLTYEQTLFNVDASRLVEIDWMYSDMNLALGFEYRNEGYEIRAGEPASYERGNFGPGGAPTDPVAGPFGAQGSQVFPGFTPASAGTNSRSNISAYIDLEGDVMENWNVTLAGRFEEYSDFGNTFNWKMSHRFDVTDAFALRASVSTGFRAPSLQQQFFTSVATVFVDGVPTETGTFNPSSDVAVALGSPGLDAEDSTNYSAGFTYTPTADFNLTVDFYQIEIEDRIVLSNNLSGSGVESLLAGTGATRARFFLNAIDTETKGVDIVSTYTLNTNDWGSVLFNAGININDNEVTDILPPPSVLQGIGFDQNNLFSGVELRRFEVGSPSDKINLSASWSYDAAAVTLRTTRYGETQDPSSIAERNEVLDPKWVTDIDASYQLNDNITLTLGANNVFDVYPDPTRENVEDVTTFSRLFAYSGFSPFGFTGRFVYGRVSYSF